MARISTHVLDTSTGKPAGGLSVVLCRDESEVLGRGTTDACGRIEELCPEGELVPGQYGLVFDTGAYFDAQHVPTLYPSVLVRFRVADSSERYHLPLLLSPHGYSTYRGH
jgi:5-hydroxyisourate hydrolase